MASSSLNFGRIAKPLRGGGGTGAVPAQTLPSSGGGPANPIARLQNEDAGWVFFFFHQSRSSRQCHSFQLPRSCELCSKSFILWSVITDCQTVTIFFVGYYSKAGILVFQRSIDGGCLLFWRFSIALVNDILSFFVFASVDFQTIMRLICSVFDFAEAEVPTNWSRKKASGYAIS